MKNLSTEELTRLAVHKYTTAPTRKFAILNLRLMGTLTDDIIEQANTSSKQQWIDTQAIILSRKAYDLSRGWRSTTNDNLANSLEEWMTHRQLALIDARGKVEGTSLSYQLAECVNYRNIGFSFQLRHRGNQMLIVNVRRCSVNFSSR